jgi:hypothetical protein
VLRARGDGWQLDAPPIEVRAGETTTIEVTARKL